MNTLWIDEFGFPNHFWPRKQYIFEKDEEGLLKGYVVSQFWGDKKRECGFESHLTEISAKKRRDTGKDAGRWRRPSYFEKSAY